MPQDKEDFTLGRIEPTPDPRTLNLEEAKKIVQERGCSFQQAIRIVKINNIRKAIHQLDDLNLRTILSEILRLVVD
jgi:hypothetical protein